MFFIFLLFFLSGFSALIFEVSWVRLLGLVLGSSAQATSCVLACFLGGIALGAYIGGKISDRLNRSQLLAYGIAECAIGIAATKILQQMPAMFAAWDRALPVNDMVMLGEQFAVSIVVLLVPTIFMGATLPLLSRYVAMSRGRTEHFFALLYGLNTFGAVAGSLFAAFIGFSYLGITGTAWSAAAVNLIVGTSAAVLSRRQQTVAATTVEPEETPTKSWGVSTKQFNCLLAISFLCGFTALSYEVLWMRLLRAFITSSTYAFTFMVSVFLTGLVLGNYIYVKWLSRKASQSFENGLSTLGFFQYLVAITSLLGFVLLPISLGVRILFKDGLWGTPGCIDQLFYEGVLSILFMLTPATFIGVCFPLLGELALYKADDVGTKVGTIYSANTVGCILGSALCGMVLIPTMGSEQAFALIIAVTLFLGYFCCFQQGITKGRIALAATPLVLFLTFMCFVHKDYLEWSFAKLSSARVLAYAEDSISRVLAMDNSEVKRLVVNGTFYSGDTLNARRYMRMLSELPTLLIEHPKRELIICFGVGNTAHMLDVNPDVPRFDVCELSRAVLACEPAFRSSNGDVLHSKKIKVYLNDGRNFLLRSRDLYDVISLEPPPPQDAGIVNLYTREFYKIAFDHLTPDGKVCQWVPPHLMKAGLFKMALQAGRAEFPYATLWITNNSEGLLICSKKPIVFDCQKIQARIDAHPEEKECLKEVGLDDACSIASTLVLAGKSLDDYLANVQPLSDERPLLEFFLSDQSKIPTPEELAAFADKDGSNFEPAVTFKDCHPEKLAEYRKIMRLLFKLDDAACAGDTTCPQQAKEILQLQPQNKFLQWTNANPFLH